MKLSEIYFKNYLLLGSGNIEFKEGFNAITGETGAGKSMLIGIINLLRGEKIVWERFKTSDTVEVGGVFLRDGEEIIIRRIINPSSKRSRFLLNDSPVTRETITKEVGDFIEVSSQHEQSSLLREDTHIDYYDTLSNLLNERKEYQKLYHQYMELKRKTEEKQKKLQELAEKREYLKFKLKELENLNTYEGEETELEEIIYRLENIETLREAFEEGVMAFYEQDDSVYAKTSEFIRKYSDILKKDAGGEKILPLAENILISAEEIFSNLKELLSTLEIDPSMLESKRERLFKLKDIMTRYGFSTTGQILEEIENLKTKIASLQIEEDEIERLRTQLEHNNKQLREAAKKLSQKRFALKKDIEKEVIRELKNLGFPRVNFEIKITESNIGEKGIDNVEFYLSTTGTSPSPLKSIASGGELSRILLAFKALSSQNQPEKILLFDEIDTGIGGKTARVVGERLKTLAKYSQVIAITHLPQIASLADAHFLVERKDEEKTMITIRELSHKERIKEIARMLSADRITDSALNHAKTLMEGKTDG